MMRKLLLLFVCAFASIGAWAGPHDVTQDPNDATKYWIGDDNQNYFTVADGVVTFHVAKTNPEGMPESLIDSPAWNNISNKFNGATRIKFANDCLITKNDLEKFLNTQQGTYYVDLFDITNGTNTPMQVDDYTTETDDNSPTNIDKIIEAAVADMVTNNWQAKGIILPLNTGSGTSKVEKTMLQWGSVTAPTFSEYAVYYRSTQKIAAIYSHDPQMQYNGTNNITNAQNNYNTAYAHLSEHQEVATAETYIVSTNNYKDANTRIDTSNLPSTVKAKIMIVNDEMVYNRVNGRKALADIYVETTEGGKFAEAVANTGISGTPCEKLAISGPVWDDDVKAVNGFSSDAVEGPYAYDLKEATDFSTASLYGITNSKVEYIILPYRLSSAKIPASYFSESMTGLKAAISSTSTQLSAYVKEPGSLLMARVYATDGATVNGSTTPTTVGLQYVTLTGTLNARDICANSDGKVGEDGHWTTGESVSRGLNGETAITAIDMEDAVFPEQYDMNFNKAGFEKLTSLLLPTSPSMNILPENCLYNIKGLKYLCVPYNYEYIRDGALNANGGGIDHLTTTDASGAEIDNGEKTWTISANVKELGTRPGENYNGEFVATVFPMNVGVTDIYCLAVKVPKCYANVFPDNACYGWGGDDPDMPYCRDRYYNGGNKDEAWAVLHFPSKESWEKSAGTKEGSYETLKQLYTDVNKVFTKKEQTGAVDANGDPIAWPTHWEGYRSYNQASLGLTWNDWDVQHNSTIEGHINDGGGISQGTPVGSQYTLNPTGVSDGSHDGDYDFTDYMGWHQIVLALATYVEPDEIIEEEKIVREYEEAGWYTFCIPFNMTYKQVVEMLGVPASTDKIINKLNGEEVTGDIMPDIRQLSSVTRKKGQGSNKNIVFLRMTPNLYEAQTPGYTSYLEITHNENSETHKLSTAEPYNASSNIDDRLCLIGGRPYIIKAYKRKQIVNGEDIYKIKGQNIAMAILTRYADQFGVEASIVENTKYESYLSYEQLGDGNLKTLRFAKPFEEHKVQAVRDGESSAYLTYDNNGNTYKYYYTMIGQFWQQPLPQYCLYMSRGNWYRYTDTSKGYTWDPYKCVIMATQELVKEEGDKHYGGGYRRGADDEYTNYPQVEEGTDDLLKSEFKLGFLDGRDDDDFDNNGTCAKYIFSFEDEGIVELDADGNETTAITKLDGEDILPTTANGKVFNMSGQHVGNSLNGLSKGMYIVNGKKVIVK